MMRTEILVAVVVGAVVVAAGAATALSSQGGATVLQSSVIVEVEGKACMGQDRSRNQTREAALVDARRRAAEQVLTYLEGQTEVSQGRLTQDLVKAYTNARIRTVATLDEGWFREQYPGNLVDECYRVRIKAEVTPDQKAMAGLTDRAALLEDPTAPLTVRAWTNKESYRKGDRIKVYLKGNKPFYAQIIYQDSTGHLIQLLPNPYRSDNYFAGGVVYEFPSGKDRFQLEISPPFGKEKITVYAATSPLGKLVVEPVGAVFSVTENARDVAEKLRSVKPVEGAAERGGVKAVEFTEAPVEFTTAP